MKLCHINRFGPVFFCQTVYDLLDLTCTAVIKCGPICVVSRTKYSFSDRSFVPSCYGYMVRGDLIRGLFIENSGNECRFLVEDNIVAKRRARRRLGVANCKLRAS